MNEMKCVILQGKNGDSCFSDKGAASKPIDETKTKRYR